MLESTHISSSFFYYIIKKYIIINVIIMIKYLSKAVYNHIYIYILFLSILI